MSVQSIERAFTLLRTIAQHPDGISVTDLSRQTKLHKSTVSRLVMSLESEDAVERVDGGLRIGNGLASLVASTLHPTALRTLVHPYLEQLAELTDETCGLCILDGDQAYYIDQVSREHAIQIRDWTGERLPLHIVSSGKLFLAYSSDKRVAEYLARVPLSRVTPTTITNPIKLRKALTTIKQQGFDWSFEEYAEGLVVVSGPIFDRHGKIAASIFVCGPAFRFPPEGKQIEITQLVIQTCQEITALIAENQFSLKPWNV